MFEGLGLGGIMARRVIVEYRFTKACTRPACWHVPCSPPPQQLSPRHPTSSHHPPCGLFFHPQPILSPHGLDIQILGIPCDLMRRPSQTFDHSTCPIQCGPSAHPANRFHPPPILSPCSLIFEFWGQILAITRSLDAHVPPSNPQHIPHP